MPAIRNKKMTESLLIAALLVSAACNGTHVSIQQTTSTPTPAIAAAVEEIPTIVAFGDSLTAGFGLMDDQQRYTALLQRRLDEGGFRYRVVDAGVSGDTTAGGVRRVDWALDKNAKILILELGGNDGLRGLPVAEMKKNLAAIIERAQEKKVAVLLAGMEAPPNLGDEYTVAFRQAFRDLAKKYNVKLIPFVLDGVAGLADMNQPDGIHPNAAGERIMTETIWRALEPMLVKD